MNWFDSWGLTLVVFLPVVGMALLLLLPREARSRSRPPP